MPKPSSGGKRPPYRRNYNSPKHRKNERIRVPEIRVIGPDGSQIGVLATNEALALAKKYGLDLVEISPTARPPVCRILDYGKFMYEQSKKTKESKTASTKLKEIKFRTHIDAHDYEFKVRHAEEFLSKGNKLKLTLMFRGRELQRTELGFEIIKRAIEDLKGMGTSDNEPKLVGRNIIVTLTPLPASRRKPKFKKVTDAELKQLEDLDDDDDDHDEELDTAVETEA